MSTDERADSMRRTRQRLRTSRGQVFAAVRQVRGESRPEALGFPRSVLMRALLGQGGRALAGGAALGLLGMWGPRWVRTLWRLAPLAPLARGALNRYVLRRIFR